MWFSAPRVPATGDRTSVRTSFACAPNVVLSQWGTQRKKQLEDLGNFSQPDIGDCGRKARNIGEYSGHSAVG